MTAASERDGLLALARDYLQPQAGQTLYGARRVIRNLIWLIEQMDEAEAQEIERRRKK